MPLYGLKKIVWIPFGGAEAAFAGGYGNYGAPFPACSIYKDQMGFVHLKGLLTGPAGAGAMVTLGSAYRPTMNEIFAQVASYSGGQLGMRVDVYPAGTINVLTASAASFSGAYLSLDGIVYNANS